MDKNLQYQNELFKKLAQSPDLKEEKALFNQLYKNSIFWIAQEPNSQQLLSLPCGCNCLTAGGLKKKRCLRYLSYAIRLAKGSREIKQFVCPDKSYGLCLPLVRGDALYGFLVVCNLKTVPSQQSLELFKALNREIVEKVQKELELSKLYQTIRPRAIALSTIHTVRRLISSSLNLEELIPRIARLSLQLLRAKRCLISLVDKKTKRLFPKAFIDLSRKKSKPRISLNVKKTERKVRRAGNILRTDACLSVPLIEEDLIGIITVFQKMNKKPFDNFDQEILVALAEQAVGAIRNAQLYKEQEDMLLGTVESLSSLLKAKSAYPYAHSKATLGIVLGIAKEMMLSEQDLRNLRFAAMLHDAGVIGIPEEILKKPARLSGKEYQIVKEHPKKSVKLLSHLEHLKPAIVMILHHHEKFDGSGYPDRLKAEEIPLGARIMAVADSFEAMISRRPYRKSTSFPEAVKEIKRYSGTQFDPRVIKAFLQFTKTEAFKKLLKGVYRGRSKKGLQDAA